MGTLNRMIRETSATNWGGRPRFWKRGYFASLERIHGRGAHGGVATVDMEHFAGDTTR